MSLRTVSRVFSIGRALLAGSMALAVPGACERSSTPDAMDDFVKKSGWLTVAADAHRADYDGDDVSDFVIYRPSTGGWWVLPNISHQAWAETWGDATDWPIQGDFDQDSKDDLGFWRPSTGEWIILLSSTENQGMLSGTWGERGDVPVPGDYNGDGKTDVAVWRRAEAKWYVALNGGAILPPVQWGEPGDEPAQADYDGDGKTDYAIWRPRTATWWWTTSSVPNGWDLKQWGATMDIPVPGADTDGDHKADLMVYRPEGRTFYWLASSENYSYATAQNYDFPGGGLDTDPIFATDIPLAGQYFWFGGGSIGFWRPSTGEWTVQDSGNSVNQQIQQWGAPGDIPINGQRSVPYVSTYRTRIANVTEYEAQVVTVPPNVAGCGANGAAFLTGSSDLSRMSLSCWQNGPALHQVATCTTQCQTNADCPSGQTCRPATGVAQASTCVYSVLNNYTQSPGVTDIFESNDNNMVRMNNGHLLYEKLLARYDPCSPQYNPGCALTSTECGVQNHRRGIAMFYDSGNCGATWTKVSGITEANFGGDWHTINVDGSRGLHNNPYSGRVYFSVENGNCSTGVGRSELFYSTNYGQSWTKDPDGLPFAGGSYSSTSSPNDREYFFACPNGQPTLYVFSESTNQITASWTDAANQCGLVAYVDGSPNVSFVSGESDGDYLRIAYPQVSSGRQTLHLSTLRLTGPDNAITVTKLADNVIEATNPNGSIVQVTQVEPDMLDLPASLRTNVTLLYWVESDGPVIPYPACQEPGSSGGLMCAASGTNVTNKGMMLRDLNIWSPVFPVSETDTSGNPIYWPNWHCYGDYRRGGFAYDPASDMLNFYAYYVGPGDNRTWHTNVISAHP